MAIKIFFNGKEEFVDDKITILDLLKKKNIKTEVVTVELNEKIVNRKDFDKLVLNDCDKVEMVYFMGGGVN